jgi:hypothetical protein
MKFAQIIEFATGHIDEFNDGLDGWMPDRQVTGYRIGRC